MNTLYGCTNTFEYEIKKKKIPECWIRSLHWRGGWESHVGCKVASVTYCAAAECDGRNVLAFAFSKHYFEEKLTDVVKGLSRLSKVEREHSDSHHRLQWSLIETARD